jgi:predicted ester cyclase
MSAKENKGLMRRLIEEGNKGKAAAMAVIDRSIDMRGDLKDFKQMESEWYDAFPDMHYTIDDMVAEGDKVAARVTMTGTHKGEIMGIPPTNKKVTVSGIVIDRFAGGKIVEDNGIFDMLGLMRQLGLVPTPKKEKVKF